MRRAVVLLSLLFAAPRAVAWVAVLPGAVEGLGQAPALFSSTLYLSNPGPQAATATFELIPYAGRSAPAPATRTIPAGGSLVVPQALKALFGLTADAGTIRVSADQPLVGSVVTSNVANPDSTYGVALSPVTDRGLLGAGDVGHAPWVSQGGGFRTNVAAVLVDPNSSVTVSVYDAAGVLAGQQVVSSPTPVSWQVPVTDLIGARDLPVGRVEFRFATGRGTGYVAVNDNVTGDAIAVQAPRLLATEQILDGVAETGGANGTYWRTDARLLNPGESPISVTVEPLGFPGAPTLTLGVAARSILDLPDVLSRFAVSAPAAGALRFRSADRFLVFGRTQNVDPSGQRPGTFAASQAAVSVPGQLLAAGQSGSFPGVEQSARFRTNLALLAPSEAASGTLSLRGPAGESLGSAPFSLRSGEWIQKSVSDWFPGASFPTGARVEAAVSSGRLDGYLTRIDNATGDPVVLGAATAAAAESDLAVVSFFQKPDPIPSSTGGSLFVSLRNYGPDSSEGALELGVTVDVTQGASKLVVQRLSGTTASDWTLVSGTFGVSQSVRLRRKSPLPPDAITEVQVAVGVAGGGTVGGSFPGSQATVAAKGDPNAFNNARALTVDMTP
jgi:hypothetical protein